MTCFKLDFRRPNNCMENDENYDNLLCIVSSHGSCGKSSSFWQMFLRFLQGRLPLRWRLGLVVLVLLEGWYRKEALGFHLFGINREGFWLKRKTRVFEKKFQLCFLPCGLGSLKNSRALLCGEFCLIG